MAQAQLGHTNICTTMKYNDMLSEYQAKAANMLDYGMHIIPGTPYLIMFNQRRPLLQKRGTCPWLINPSLLGGKHGDIIIQ